MWSKICQKVRPLCPFLTLHAFFKLHAFSVPCLLILRIIMPALPFGTSDSTVTLGDLSHQILFSLYQELNKDSFVHEIFFKIPVQRKVCSV